LDNCGRVPVVSKPDNGDTIYNLGPGIIFDFLRPEGNEQGVKVRRLGSDQGGLRNISGTLRSFGSYARGGDPFLGVSALADSHVPKAASGKEQQASEDRQQSGKEGDRVFDGPIQQAFSFYGTTFVCTLIAGGAVCGLWPA